MAFTGTATKTYLGKNIVRITGLSLAAGASGTIGNYGSGAEVTLQSSYPTITTSTKVEVVKITLAFVVSIAKGGTPVIATFTNTDGGSATGDLEIWIQNVHSVIA